MLSYFDSSALVKLVVDREPHQQVAEEIWAEATPAVASTLAYAEVCSALAAAERDGRLRSTERVTALRLWSQLWTEADAIELTDELAQAAGEVAARYALTGADAVHLASALSLGLPLRFVAWDRRLRGAAVAEGLEVAPGNVDD